MRAWLDWIAWQVDLKANYRLYAIWQAFETVASLVALYLLRSYLPFLAVLLVQTVGVVTRGIATTLGMDTAMATTATEEAITVINTDYVVNTLVIGVVTLNALRIWAVYRMVVRGAKEAVERI